MGVHENIDYDQFPIQRLPMLRVDVCFHYGSQCIKGTIIRDDREAPFDTIIQLDDGRVVRGAECHYRPSDDQTPKSNWIPVSERLPDEEGLYLACGVEPDFIPCGPIVDTLIWNGEFWVFTDDEETEYENGSRYVSAWQPLPNPYGVIING